MKARLLSTIGAPADLPGGAEVDIPFGIQVVLVDDRAYVFTHHSDHLTNPNTVAIYRESPSMRSPYSSHRTSCPCHPDYGHPCTCNIPKVTTGHDEAGSPPKAKDTIPVWEPPGGLVRPPAWKRRKKK